MAVVRQQRDNVFDFLRLFAAATVVVFHSTNLLKQTFLWHGPTDSLWFFDGVSMFFIMSGMFVYISAERTHAATGKWREYFRNRYLRIAPAVYAYTLIMLIFVPLVGAAPWPKIFTVDILKWIGLSFLLMPGYDPAAYEEFGTGILNGSVWTIPAEVSFYVAVPVLCLLGRRIGFNRILFLSAPVAVVAPIITHLSSPSISNLLHHTFLEYFSCFLLGMFWSHYWKVAPKHWVLFVAAIALYITALRLPSESVSDLLDPLLIAVPLSYATVWFGYHGPLFLKRFTDRVGDLSFGTYLWHWPVINFFIWAGWNVGPLAVPGVLLTTVVLASLSWWLVEKPALRSKKVSARTTPPAVPGAGSVERYYPRHLTARD